MLSRSIVLPGLLAAAVGVPYFATNAPEWIDEQGKAASAGDVASYGDPALPGPDGILAPPQGPGSDLYPTQTPIEGFPTYSLGEVMRLDVSKEWVYHRWARKSTSLADLRLFGVRVPLVTGAQLHDLAGSLSYYFGPDGRVHRLTFRGRTADTTQIVAIAMQRFGMQPEAPISPGEQVFRARNEGHVISELRTTPAPVLWESSPHDSFNVELIVQRPETSVPLEQLAWRKPLLTEQAVTADAGLADQTENLTANPQTTASTEPSSSPSGSSEPPWKAFFPRSRVPRPQVDSLEKRRSMW